MMLRACRCLRELMGGGMCLVTLVTACESADNPAGPTGTGPVVARNGSLGSSAPDELVEVTSGNHSSSIWPWISSDLTTPDDPVNLVFAGRADPMELRDALLGLTLDRGPTFPAAAPFNCTWSDAIGGLMAGYGRDGGWSGTAVQLQCGAYGPMRFHLRLVRLGGLTIGNAHFEVLIPGTTDHQVLSWELAEQLVAFDLARSGLLGAPPGATAPINSSPTHRGIPAVIYNGLPVELRVLIGGPLGNVAADVGIANDGKATSFLLRRVASPAARQAEQHLVLQFNQVIPKPFCASDPREYLLVQGPVSLDQGVAVSPSGALQTTFRAKGTLQVVPLDIVTLQPIGAPMTAEVSEFQKRREDREGGTVQGLQHQVLGPLGQPGAGALLIRMKVGPGEHPQFDRKEHCQ